MREFIPNRVVDFLVDVKSYREFNDLLCFGVYEVSITKNVQGFVIIHSKIIQNERVF